MNNVSINGEIKFGITLNEVVEWAKHWSELKDTNVQTKENFLTQKMMDMAQSQTSLKEKDFQALMEKLGLGGDPILIAKLFWVFDKNGDGEIDYKELILGFEMLK